MGVSINCIIVDDEPVARELLQKFVADVPVLNLLRSCSNAFEAAEVMMQQEVQLIFLDINMPRLSGMSFYKSLSKPPAVIFTTAYPQYALEGFEVDATDYLLKPFSFDRFYKAVSRVQEKLEKPVIRPDEDYILLRADKKIHRIKLADLLYLESMGDYVKVHLKGSYLLVHERLKHMIKLLPQDFIQVHKSFVLPIGNVQYIEGNMVRINDQDIPIGSTYKELFLQALAGNPGE